MGDAGVGRGYHLVVRWLQLFLASSAAYADAPKKAVVSTMSFSTANDKMRVRYELERSGMLHYSAYYNNMPTNMNHNDSVDWKSGAAGAKAIGAIGSVVDDLTKLSDDQEPPPEAFVVTVSIDNADSTRVATDHAGKPWRVIDPPFRAMIAAFEKATGRPIPAAKLPQSP